VLTSRHRADTRRQNISSQNSRRKEDVVELRKVNVGEGVTKWN
jgi:hypothetical protein